jgi:hypothetical protein
MNHEYTPPQLSFVESDLSVEERYNAVMGMLSEFECQVEFIKVNGEERSMLCTLREDMLPIAGRVIAEDVAEAQANSINHNVVTVWSTEVNAWRAMRTMNIKSVRLAPMKWTTVAEEDPETGDIMLTLPEELVKLQGWKEGDTLNWEDNGDGSWSLSKQSL